MNLKAITRIYKQKYRTRVDNELDWFKNQPDIESALYYAGIAENRYGKRFHHQRRIKRVALEQSKDILLAKKSTIMNAENFDGLFTIIKNIVEPIVGIGELYIYDTSFRISIKMEILPEKVYIHAGTRIGAEALGFSGKAKYIEKKELPIEFSQLEAYEIEDILCIFKSKLQKINLDI